MIRGNKVKKFVFVLCALITVACGKKMNQDAPSTNDQPKSLQEQIIGTWTGEETLADGSKKTITYVVEDGKISDGPDQLTYTLNGNEITVTEGGGVDVNVFTLQMNGDSILEVTSVKDGSKLILSRVVGSTVSVPVAPAPVVPTAEEIKAAEEAKKAEEAPKAEDAPKAEEVTTTPSTETPASPEEPGNGDNQ
jgi:uncharacterized protein YacL (UPF0231 family)